MKRPRYVYQLVSGGAVYTVPDMLCHTLRNLQRVQTAWPTMRVEVERILRVGSGRRYWLRRAGKWQLWSTVVGDPSDDDLSYWRDKAKRWRT